MPIIVKSSLSKKLTTFLKSKLFTIIESAHPNINLNNFFFKIFFDHPDGDELDLTITLVLNNFEIKIQYQFA